VSTTDVGAARVGSVRNVWKALFVVACFAGTILLLQRATLLYDQSGRTLADVRDLRSTAGSVHDIASTAVADPHLYSVFARNRELPNIQPRTLLAFATDDCPACFAAIEGWATLSRDAHLDVKLVLPDSAAVVTQITRAFRSRGIEPEILVPRVPELYAALSGISAMPLALEITDGAKVACALAGEPTPEALRGCAEFARAPQNASYVFRGPNTKTWSHWLTNSQGVTTPIVPAK
jgi:hypothetical protein